MNIESIRAAVAEKIDSAAFQTWIAPLQFTVCQNCLDVVAQNQFTADYITREYGNTLKNIAADFSLDLNICVRPINNVVQSANDNVVCEFVKTQKQSVKNKNGFDTFVCSDENMFAVAAVIPFHLREFDGDVFTAILSFVGYYLVRREFFSKLTLKQSLWFRCRFRRWFGRFSRFRRIGVSTVGSATPSVLSGIEVGTGVSVGTGEGTSVGAGVLADTKLTFALLNSVKSISTGFQGKKWKTCAQTKYATIQNPSRSRMTMRRIRFLLDFLMTVFYPSQTHICAGARSSWGRRSAVRWHKKSILVCRRSL